MRGKVLILNRRCPWHPQSGGAERYTLELARFLVDKGYGVVWFSSRADGLKSKEAKNNILFMRKGNELTTHLYGFLHLLKNKELYSLVIDEFNGTGYFSFWHESSVVLFHQLYQEFFNAEFGVMGYPLRYIEKFLARLYRKTPCLTVSESTKEDLLNLGFERVSVINPPLSYSVLSEPPAKEKTLTLVYLGRLKKTKNPEDALKSFALVKEKVKDARMIVVGDGPLRNYLENRYRIDGLIFTGFIPESKKLEILKKSHFLLVPSIREGWGMVVIEANSHGTPAIGYKVHGLRDSIRDGITGALVSNYKEMADRVLELWQDRDSYLLISRRCLEWAKRFTAEAFRSKVAKFVGDYAKIT